MASTRALSYCPQVLLMFVSPLFAPASQQLASPGLTAAVQRYAEKRDEHDALFKHALADLNGDGRDDAIVLLLGSNWCGSGGCNMLIFRGTRTGFVFISGSTITNEPIRVARERARGWRSLIVYSKSKGDVLMRFNGSRYPLNPSIQPEATPGQLSDARIVMK